jgi:hypothetical protein
MINHAPRFDTEKIIEIYEKKDGVPIKYVCTTDLKNSDVPFDIFYRETPHPVFGNRYFGLFIHPTTNDVMIGNADIVEDYVFEMIADNDGDYWYSQSHHDCLFIDGGMIDGGRVYTRSSGKTFPHIVRNGELIPA